MRICFVCEIGNPINLCFVIIFTLNLVITRMSVTVTKAEGVTVLTLTSNEGSNCPLLCQILGNLCYSPVCSVSQKLKINLGGTLTALGSVQIMIGLLTIGLGSVLFSLQDHWDTFPSRVFAPFWLGSMFMVFGVMCILGEKFPSPCLVVITGMMNAISIGSAITAIVVYAIDTAGAEYWGDLNCDGNNRYDYRPSPIPPLGKEENIAICKRNQAAGQVLKTGMDIVMIISAIVQLGVAISAFVLTFRVACKKGIAQQDPQLREPLVYETLSNPAV
ncbi:membrane-spanning 4-domains subfamily A member 8-like [Engraulis encrasicolus]|uniref:membrane-spanning 4-domains subfamily A member 8-like n=1 Tax=Engraulis encrasicolus TaxID=184585 RepID=UPI002FD5DBC6